MQLIDGRALARDILDTVQKQIAALDFQPVFCDVLVGNDPASVQYVEMKEKRAEKVGFSVHRARFPETITTTELVQEIETINKLPNMCGLIVQLPLPDHIETQKVLDAIEPAIDVDVLGSVNTELFYGGNARFVFPTAAAVVEVLASVGVVPGVSQKQFVVVGQGALVGRPVTYLLREAGASVAVIDQATEAPAQIFATADVVISAVGKDKLISGEHIKQGVIIVDAGTSEADGNIVGDVDIASVSGKASHVSPVPGGVGPVTIAKLFKNVLKAAKRLQ